MMISKCEEPSERKQMVDESTRMKLKTKEEAEGSAKGKGKSTEKAEAGLAEGGGATE